MAGPPLKAVLLDSGRDELKRVRRYVIEHFGIDTWEASYDRIKASIAHVRQYPASGEVISALEFTGGRFREVISGQNRIIYEIRQDAIYIHLIIDTRRDLTALLQSIAIRLV